MVARLDGADQPATDETISSDDLPYRIDLKEDEDTARVRILARASNASLAQAIFRAAQEEHPGRHITLRHCGKIIASSNGT